MKQISKLSLIISLSIFTAFNFVSAQTAAPPGGITNQNQPPNYNPAIVPYPQTSPIVSQTPSPTQTPKQNIKPLPKITPTPAPSPAKELPPQTQNRITAPETPISAQTTGQNTVDTSGSPSYFLYIIIPAIIILAAFWKKLIELLKKKSEPRLPAEDDGTVCKACGGSGKITRIISKSMPCGRCKRTGNNPCHYCNGSGKYGVGLTVPQTQDEVDSLMDCPYCGGKGFPKVRTNCEFCHGTGKIEFNEPYEETCSNCKGSGRIK